MWQELLIKIKTLFVSRRFLTAIAALLLATITELFPGMSEQAVSDVINMMLAWILGDSIAQTGGVALTRLYSESAPWHIELREKLRQLVISRRFLAALSGLLLVICTELFGLPEDAVQQILNVIMVWIVGDSFMKTGAERIRAFMSRKAA